VNVVLRVACSSLLIFAHFIFIPWERTTIMCRWFRQTKFPSFQRQLNLYGFKRLTSGEDKGGKFLVYYSCFFLRRSTLTNLYPSADD
jgi:hypothetical protein